MTEADIVEVVVDAVQHEHTDAHRAGRRDPRATARLCDVHRGIFVGVAKRTRRTDRDRRQNGDGFRK
jgi:hypothetical protein